MSTIASESPESVRRLTAPDLAARKRVEPIVMLTTYTARIAELLDRHCDVLLVGDSLAQTVYGFASTLPVSLDMMIAHGAAVVRGSRHALVVVDMPSGSCEECPEQAFRSASRVMRETGAGAVKLEGGVHMAATIEHLNSRGIRLWRMLGCWAHPESVNTLVGYKPRGRDNAEFSSVMPTRAHERAQVLLVAGELGLPTAPNLAGRRRPGQAHALHQLDRRRRADGKRAAA